MKKLIPLKITELSDEELKSIYDKFFFSEDTDKPFYLIRDGYGGLSMGQDDSSGTEVRMTDNGSIYLYCCDNGEIYDSTDIASCIQYLKTINVYPFAAEAENPYLTPFLMVCDTCGLPLSHRHNSVKSCTCDNQTQNTFFSPY